MNRTKSLSPVAHPNALEMDTSLMQKAVLHFRALNNHRRQTMLKLIHAHGSLTVTELYTKLRVEQAVASQQLAILRRVRLVIATRKGKQVLYAVNYPQLILVQETAKDLVRSI